MTERETLIRLILQAAPGVTRWQAQAIAEALLAEGVRLLPCKVGNPVWYVFATETDGAYEVIREQICDILVANNGIYVSCDNCAYDIPGSNGVYLSEAEAIRELERLSRIGTG